MPQVSESENPYWMPDSIPESTEEYNNIQRQKRYLTNLNMERIHPGWHYDNRALVDDEYLFQNEGWKVVIDNPPQEQLFKKVVRNDVYSEIDKKTLEVNYEIVNFTQDEIDTYIEGKWDTLRQKRNNLLTNTDWSILVSCEKNEVVSDEIKNYRQQLRDFPETIGDIVNFDILDDQNWPTKPEFS